LNNFKIIRISLGKANIDKRLCDCPHAEPGKINIHASAHEANCWIRKRLVSKRFTVDTSVTPEHVECGYRLGVAI
jgi:hypothetical protein